MSESERNEFIDAQLIIKWELMNIHGTAASGSGIIRRRENPDMKVWFRLTNVDYKDHDSLKNGIYNLYKLDDASWELIDSDHEKFKKEIGNTKEYGEEFNLEPVNHSFNTRYVIGYKEDDINKQLIGKIRFQSVLNPFPHMIVK